MPRKVNVALLFSKHPRSRHLFDCVIVQLGLTLRAPIEFYDGRAVHLGTWRPADLGTFFPAESDLGRNYRRPQTVAPQPRMVDIGRRLAHRGVDRFCLPLITKTTIESRIILRH